MKKYNYFEIVVSVAEFNAMQFSENYARFIFSRADGVCGNVEFCLIVDEPTLKEIEGLKEECIEIVSKTSKVKGYFEICSGIYNTSNYKVVGKFCTLRGLMNRLHASGAAKDVTLASDRNAIPESYRQIGYAAGLYGCSGMLLLGESGQLYAVTSRTSAIYIF